jgi:hypothetical protein
VNVHLSCCKCTHMINKKKRVKGLRGTENKITEKYMWCSFNHTNNDNADFAETPIKKVVNSGPSHRFVRSHFENMIPS